MPLLADRLGTTSHLSPLLQKARLLGIGGPRDLENIALSKGLRYYGRPDPGTTAIPACQTDAFSTEELTIALMSPSAPYSLNRLRMAGALLGTPNISAARILKLARRERCEAIVRHLAEQAIQVEPGNPFWRTLLDGLPELPPVRPDALPHLSRLVAMSGLSRDGLGPRMQWIRPSA